jgi:hypothetical protein
MGSVIIAIILIIIAIIIVKAIFGEKIEVNFAREKIYGWYNLDILCYASFSREMSAEEINKIKKEVSEKLKIEIVKYKQINR